MFVILFSRCTQRLPSIARLFGGRRRGAIRVDAADSRGSVVGGTTTRNGGSNEAENRLIDSLDEEWE